MQLLHVLVHPNSTPHFPLTIKGISPLAFYIQLLHDSSP